MAWYVTIYDALLQWAVAGFMLLAIATCALLAIRQPARQIRVIEMTLVGLVVLPWLALIPGYPRVGVWPALSSDERDDDETPSGAISVVERDGKNPPAEPGAIATMPAMSVTESSAVLEDSFEPSVGSSADTPQWPIANVDRGVKAGWRLPRDVRFWIVSGYLAGAGAMVAWSLIGLAAIARLLRSARPADAACRAVLREVAGQRSARVALLVSDRASQPCALVWRRPTIVLPANLAAADDARQLRWAMAHEWSHIARGDVWTWALSSFARWFCFYQPLFWPLRRQLRLCQDYLADAAAAGAGTEAEDYAQFLASYSSRLKHPSAAGGLGIAGRASDLRRRIVMLVNRRRVLERAVPRRWNLLAPPIAILLVCAVSLLGSRSAQSAVEAPGKTQDDASASPPDRAATAPAEEPLDAAPPQQPLPSQAAVDAEAEKDPVVVELTRYMAKLFVKLAEARNQSPDAVDQASIKQLQRQILQVGEMIDDHKAQLRPKILDRLAAAQRIEERPRPPRAFSSVPPFSGQIRPGDLLTIDLAGGFPTTGPADPATVEPDGNVALGPLYGGRVNVRGKTLSEAQEIIRKRLLEFLKDPQVQVTYQGHNPDVVPEGTAPPASEGRSDSQVPLAPFDTVEVLMPLKPQVHREMIDGKVSEVYSGSMPRFSGTYVIEPDGDIALPHGYGRVNVKGKNPRQAGAAIRDRLSEKMLTRTALPTVHVVKRGRAVFADGNKPPADYRVRPGDSLLIGQPRHEQAFNYKVDPDGNIGEEREVSVAGLTLAGVQDAVRKGWKQSNFPGQEPEHEVAWYVTIGGWREEADPDVIDGLEGNDQTRLQRLERELQELKDLIRRLNR